LVESLFDQGQFQKLLDQTRSSDWGKVGLRAPILSFRGHVLLSLGRVAEAQDAFEAALQLRRNSRLPGWVGRGLRSNDLTSTAHRYWWNSLWRPIPQFRRGADEG